MTKRCLPRRMKTQVDVPMSREMDGSDAGMKAGQEGGLKAGYMVGVSGALVAVAEEHFFMKRILKKLISPMEKRKKHE